MTILLISFLSSFCFFPIIIVPIVYCIYVCIFDFSFPGKEILLYLTWGNGLDIPEQLTKLEDRWSKIFTGQDKSVRILVHLCNDEYNTVRWEQCGPQKQGPFLLYHLNKAA